LQDIKFFIDETHGGRVYQSLQRILFLFAKLNDSVKYVQGMNDICGTIFYVFSSTDHPEWNGPSAVEADTFFCFQALIQESSAMYIRSLDETDRGIRGRIQQFAKLIRLHDPELFALLDSQGLDASFYGIRWLRYGFIHALL
jgi:hypothetical protein